MASAQDALAGELIRCRLPESCACQGDHGIERTRASIVPAARQRSNFGEQTGGGHATLKSQVPKRPAIRSELPANSSPSAGSAKIVGRQPYLEAAMRRDVAGYEYWFHRQIDVRSLRLT